MYKSFLLFGMMSASLFASNVVTQNVGSITIDGKTAQTDEKPVTKACNVSKFYTLDIEGAMEVRFVESGEVSCQITASRDIIDKIDFEQQGYRLKIYSKRGYSTTLPILIELSSPKLSALFMDGSTNVELKGLSASALRLNIDGANELRASGSIESVTATADGANKVDMSTLIVQDATINASGTSEVLIHATKSIDATAEGVASVGYKGKPKVRKKLSGLGEVVAID